MLVRHVCSQTCHYTFYQYLHSAYHVMITVYLHFTTNAQHIGRDNTYVMVLRLCSAALVVMLVVDLNHLSSSLSVPISLLVVLVQKDGQQMPGKKGINLPPDQFHKLLEAQASVTEALEAQDASFDIALSGK